MKRVVASIEARMTSTRLPGKVLMDIEGAPTLTRVLQRLRRCRRLDDVVLATSTSSTDDVLEEWAASEGLDVFRGSELDVLERVTGAHRQMASDVVVEVHGDSPLLDPDIIDLGIETFFENTCDVVTNSSKASFPQGVSVQVFPLSLLEVQASENHDPEAREHVSLGFYRAPERYRVLHLLAPARWHAPDLRFQLDYEEDLLFIREVYARLTPVFGEGFGIEEIMNLLRDDPTILEINEKRTRR